MKKGNVDVDVDLEGTDLMARSLPEERKRRINLVAGKTLGTLRRESKLDLADLKYEPPSLVLGPKLGQGGFSSVYQVKGDPTVACKFLSQSTLDRDDEQLAVAASDIIREAYFLASLKHPNIIAFKGEGSLDDISKYYVLLERIKMPLSDKLKDWGLATVENHYPLEERLAYALQIVRAMQYLHDKNIVFRDLKIDNLGLNAANEIIVYDFGLAKELKGEPSHNGKYKLSGNTGSWSYMAPEVAKGHRYNLSVDVFSFGIIVWELCAGRYAAPRELKCQADIVERNVRPPLSRNWPLELEQLMRDCWNWNPNGRPSFHQVDERLTQVINKEFPQNDRQQSSFFAFLKRGPGLIHQASTDTVNHLLKQAKSG